MAERYTANKTITMQYLEESVTITGSCDTCGGERYYQARISRSYQAILDGISREQQSWSDHCSQKHGLDSVRQGRTHHHGCPECGQRYDCGLAARKCWYPVAATCARCRREVRR